MNATVPIRTSIPDRRVIGRHVDVQHVWKAYTPGHYVVRDVTLTLLPGEFLSLLGPSGSGKTSTLMMVAGFETPDEGRICVDGKDVANRPPERRNFGVVFQGYALFPHISVLANVEFPLAMKRVARSQRRRQAMEMLDKVGLADFAGRRPRELSGGQQQRVALARALVFETDALLLDEPLGALDRKLREQLQVEIKEIQQRVGISILYVTHDQDEAMMMSDRIAIMHNGEIMQIGSPSDVYLHPDTPFVASFLGETNLLPVTLEGLDDGRAVVRYAGGAIGRARLPHFGRHPRIGEHALVSVRPERIRLNGSIEGMVTAHNFLGRHARIAVQAMGRSLVVSTTDAASLRRGDAVRLGWNENDAQLLNDNEGAGNGDK